MRDWEKVNLAEARVPQKAINKFIKKLEEERCLLHGFAMLDRGKLLAEEYWAPFTADTLHRMYSVGKSFVSLAIGLLEEEGKLSLDDCIHRYFPDKYAQSQEVSGQTSPVVCALDAEPSGQTSPVVCTQDAEPSGEELHPWVRGLTIRQMLTMTTCHAKTTYKLYDGDWVESFFRVPPTNLPGAVFAYDTSSTHVLSALVERLSGMKLLDYLRVKCFDRIGFSKEAFYMPDPAGVSQGGSGLNCTLRDLLAVAELVLNEGMYQGEQLLSKDYLKEATSFQIATLQQPAYDEQLGYGYQIWRGRHNSFYFYGIGGQLAVCLPGEQFILVTMGNTLENKNGIKTIFDAFYECIYPYVEEKNAEVVETCEAKGMVENADADTEEYRSSHSLPKVPVAESTESSQYFSSGECYVFDKNMLEISKLQMSIEKNCGTLCMTKEGKEFALHFGLDDYVRGRFPGTGAECHCQGDWVMGDMFFIRCYILGPDMANLYICLRFTEAGVTVKLTKGADDMMKNFEGVASGVQKK